MRNRFIAGKLKRRCTVRGVGYFKPQEETLSRKPAAKSCGFSALGFWLSCGPQSQLPMETATGLARDSAVTTAHIQTKPERAAGVSASILLKILPCHIRCAGGSAAVSAVLDSRAAERRVSPFFYLPSP